MMPEKKCQRCKGTTMLCVEIMNHRTKDYVEAIVGCPNCDNGVPNPKYGGVEFRKESPYGDTGC